MISYADPATYAGCESTPGHVAELKKRDKHRDHPVFDAHLRRRVPFDFVALSFERHGRWANETVSFTKKLASRRALAAGLEPAEEFRRWYAVISCAIQRTNAKILRGEPVPAAIALPDCGASEAACSASAASAATWASLEGERCGPASRARVEVT